MLGIKIQFTGDGDKLINQRLLAMPEVSSKIVETLANDMVEEMQSFSKSAWDTGRHHDSITAKRLNKFTYEVGATGKASTYSIFLELGTNKSRGRYIKKFNRRFSREYLKANPPPFKNSQRLEERWIGTHPGNKGKFGQRGLRFVEQTVKWGKENIQIVGEEVLQMYLDTGRIT